LHSLKEKNCLGSRCLTTNRRSFVSLFLVVALFVSTISLQMAGSSTLAIDQIYTSGVVIVPGTQSENLFLFAQSNTWIENGARRSRGYVEYQVPMSGNFPTIIEIDAAGPYQIDISTGERDYETLYSSGQMDGSLSGRMKRQIKLEVEIAPPVRIRIGRREQAPDPFTLWRLAVRRQLDLYPGSAAENGYLFDAGSSSLPSGGGRLIPGNTAVSYNLDINSSMIATAIIDATGEFSLSKGSDPIDLIQINSLYYAQFEVSEENSIFTINSITDVKLTRMTFFVGAQCIDPYSDLSPCYLNAPTNESGIMLSGEPISLDLKGDTRYFWCFCTQPSELKIFGHTPTIWQNMVFVKPEHGIEALSLTGSGAIIAYGFDDDSDDDGVPDYPELAFGSDPILSRSDNDDVGDLEDKCPLDSDSDGLNDHIEEFLQVSPSYPDSNSDGYPDGVGQNGFKLTNMCARVTNKPWPGAMYQDITDTSLVSDCRKFGTTSIVIPFHDILINRNPEAALYSALGSIGDSDGFLLDTCAISEDDFKNPVLIDEYQIWGKRLWTDIETDDTLAYSLNGFAQDRILELLTIAREFANSNEIHFALSVPSPSLHELWFSPYDYLKIADRIIVTAPSIPSDGISYRAGIFDSNIIGKPFFVKSENEINTRAYTSAVYDKGMYLGSAVDTERPLYLHNNGSSYKEPIFAQIVDQSTIWSKKLDKVNIHQNWQSTFATKEIDCSTTLPYELDDQISIALLDCSTTFLSPDTISNVADWIKAGGSLFVYDGVTRFSDVTWWGDRKTLGEVICELLNIKKVEADKLMAAGEGQVYITKTDPIFSMFTFTSLAGITLPKTPCSYCGFESPSIEADFAELVYKVTGEYPKKEYPITIKPDFSQAPYLAAATCAVPWIGTWGKNLKILAQAPKGMCSTFAIALDDKPLSVTSNASIDWKYDSGILFISFVASGGGDGFVVSLDEALDLASISLSIMPAEPETESIIKILATIYNSSNIPSGEYSVTFHWDELNRESQFKRISLDGLSGKSYEYLNFPAPLSLKPGKHKIFIALHCEDELNDTNNVLSFEFNVKEKTVYKTISMSIGSGNAFVDGVMVSLDSPPVITNGRTMVPFRFLAESLGAAVEWDGTDRMVTFKKDDTVIYLWIGRDYAIVGSDLVNLDSPPIIINGRTMVPLRFISETLGAEVEWNGATRTVTVRQKL